MRWIKESMCLACLVGIAAAQEAFTPASDVPATSFSPLGSSFRFGDFDGDDLVDVYVIGRNGPDRLLWNRGRGAFEDVTAAHGLEGITGTRVSLWQDFDGDGALDLYVLGHAKGRLFQNTGLGHFVDVTAEAGLVHDCGAELDAEWLDFDRDRRPDLHLIAECGDLLFVSRGGGRFERAPLPLMAEPPSPMAMTTAAISPPLYLTPAKVSGMPAIAPALSAHCLGCTISGDEIEDATIKGLDIAMGEIVGSFHIASNSIMGDQIVPGTITSIHLSQNSVSGGKITDGSVMSADIAPSAVIGVLHIADSSITGEQVLSGSITTTEIADGTITFDDIAYGGITGGQILDETLLGVDIGADEVTGGHVADGSLTGSDVADGTLTGGDIADASLEGVDIATGTVATNVLAQSGASLGQTLQWNGTAWVAGGGQWSSTTSTDIYYGVGNVGIGTSSPTSTLDVEGNAWIESFAASPNAALEVRQHVGTSDGVVADNGAATGHLAARGTTLGDNTPVDTGVWGHVSGANPQSAGVIGSSPTSFGVYGESLTGIGVSAYSEFGAAVRGECDWGNAVEGVSDTGNGVYGETNVQSSSVYGGKFIGPMASTGSKFFLQPHPNDASKQIRFICLEGNESGTYFRGSAQMAGGRAVIDVPEDFRLVSQAEGLTVQVTPVGLPALLWIESKSLETIVVRSNLDVAFDYFASGVRRGYADEPTIVDNDAYVPKYCGVPFGTQYPQGIRDILVANGILNVDYTPNEVTARRMGWKLRATEESGGWSKPARAMAVDRAEVGGE